MKHFAYRAIDASGRAVEGEIEVNEEKELQLYFERNKLTPIRVSGKRFPLPNNLMLAIKLFFKKKLFETELIAFTRQFAGAYEAGLPVSNILSLLSKSTTHTEFRGALESVTEKIHQGKGLTEAMVGFPYFFNRSYLAILSSGEVSGNLGTVLNYSANLLEKKLTHRERLKAAFLYPKLVLLVIGITVAVVIAFVIPQFAKFYDRFDAQLPLPTRFLIMVSDFFTKNWWTGVTVFSCAYLLWRYLKQNPKFVLMLDKMMIKIPILGPTFLKIDLTHFCTTYALLMRAGIKVTEATQICIDGIRNSYLRQQLGIIIPTIEQGGTMGEALSKVPLIPGMMVSMITMGEESGTIDALLDRVATLYENETDMILKKLPTLLEPVILAFLFVLVLTLALAVYLPMFKIPSLLKK